MVLCCVAVLAAGCGNATAQFPPNSGQACPVASPQQLIDDHLCL